MTPRFLPFISILAASLASLLGAADTVSSTSIKPVFGMPLIPDLIADPSIVEIDGTFYCYATTDGMGAGLGSAGLPVVWKSKDFVNWSFEDSIFSAGFDAKYWAPSGLISKAGRYYLFPTLNERITSLVSRSPEGPFLTLDGKPITKESGWEPMPMGIAKPIDAEVFVDDDGTAYMAWAQRGIGRLTADLSGIEGTPSLVSTKRPGYSEGPILLKRKGVYYYLYTLAGHERYQYAYMMSRVSALGPWEAPAEDIIARSDSEAGVYGPGHGCVLNLSGTDSWYFIYLEYGRGGTNRQIWADRMEFNEDGTIRPIKVGNKGVGALRSQSEAARNLALGASATASSIAPEYRVKPRYAETRMERIEKFDTALALDASNGSRWMAAEGDPAPWFQIDLGATRHISRTELYFVKPTAGHSYVLEYSVDGTAWLAYGGQEELLRRSPHRDQKSVSARYLRLKILKGTPGLWEFRVY